MTSATSDVVKVITCKEIQSRAKHSVGFRMRSLCVCVKQCLKGKDLRWWRGHPVQVIQKPILLVHSTRYISNWIYENYYMSEFIFCDIMPCSQVKRQQMFRRNMSPPSSWSWCTPNKTLLLQLPAHAGSSLADFYTLKMETIRSSETSVHTRSTRRHIQEDGILRGHRCENLKSYTRHYWLPVSSCWFLPWLILRLWKWSRHVHSEMSVDIHRTIWRYITEGKKEPFTVISVRT
jgi:hypothetical protein